MSATPSTNEAACENLDLNSEAVPLGEEEFAKVRVTESTVTVSVSEAETLTEQASNGQGDAEGSNFEGGTEEVRVSAEGGDLVETLFRVSDVRVERDSDGVEGTCREEAADFSLFKEGVEKEMEAVDGGADVGFDASLSLKIGASDPEELGAGCGVAKVESSTKVTELTVEETLVFAEGEVAEMENAEVLNPRDVGFDASLSLKVGDSDAEELKAGCVVAKVESSAKIIESTVEGIQVVTEGEDAKMENAEVLNPRGVGFDASLSLKIGNSDAEELEAGCVVAKVESSSEIIESTVEEIQVVAEEEDAKMENAEVLNPGGVGFDASLSHKVSASNAEELKAECGVAKVESSTWITESTVEEIQVVAEGEVAEMENAEVLNPQGGVLGRNALDGSSSCPEKNQGLEIEGVKESTEENGVVYADPSVSVVYLSNGDHENADNCDNHTSSQDKEREMVAQVVETLSDQSINAHHVEENANQGGCVTVDSNSFNEVNESHATVSCASLPSDVEANAAQVTESVGPLDGNLDADVQATCTHASSHEDQNVDSAPIVENQSLDVEVETEMADRYCKQDENQIEGAQSQLIGNESDIGGLVVNSDTLSGTDGNRKTVAEVLKEDEATEVKEMGYCVKFPLSGGVDENATNNVCEVGSYGNQTIVTAEQVTGVLKQADLKPGIASVNDDRASYVLAPEKEGEFSVSDLVWGKVKSHPWWPGQIFDPLDSSEQALKHRKKDSFLVAYFGDRTFAWSEAALLKPIRTYFSQMEKQTSLESVHNAVNCALDEISRRVELGLACSCTPEEVYTKIRFQIIENAGIREESRRRGGVDKSFSVVSFEPQKLVNYIRDLALFPSGGGDRLELVIAQAHLLAFYRSKGYSRLPEFQLCGCLLENEADGSLVGGKPSKDLAEHPPVSVDEKQVASGKRTMETRVSSSRKRGHTLEDGVYPSRNKKERSLSELMDGKKASSFNGGSEPNGKVASKLVSPPSGKKRKAIDSFSDDSEGKNRKLSVLSSGAADTESSHPKLSFNVGECMRRAASQLTGSPPILKCSSERLRRSSVKVDRSSEKSVGVGADVSPHTPEESQRRRMVIPMEQSSPDEMLSQLCLAARDPKKGYSFLTIMVSFFSDFRNSVIVHRPGSGKHKKSSGKVGGGKNRISQNSNTDSGESFSFEDIQDSYWTDRIVQITPEEQPSHKNRKKKSVSQLESLTKMDISTFDPENSLQLSHTLDYEQQGLYDNRALAVEKPLGNVNGNYEDDFSPVALILSFTEADSVPSERNLNKIFRRFGPLKESETEVIKQTNHARVVFKRRTDAEVAFSSAGKFNIFGPVLVSYQLRYMSSSPAIAASCALSQGVKDMASVEGNTI